MTTYIRCDGDCGRELADRTGRGLMRVELVGRRAEFTTGAYGMPADDFHLCGDCGRRAFAVFKRAAVPPGEPVPGR